MTTCPGTLDNEPMHSLAHKPWIGITKPWADWNKVSPVVWDAHARGECDVDGAGCGQAIYVCFHAPEDMDTFLSLLEGEDIAYVGPTLCRSQRIETVRDLMSITQE